MMRPSIPATPPVSVTVLTVNDAHSTSETIILVWFRYKLSTNMACISTSGSSLIIGSTGGSTLTAGSTGGSSLNAGSAGSTPVRDGHLTDCREDSGSSLIAGVTGTGSFTAGSACGSGIINITNG